MAGAARRRTRPGRSLPEASGCTLGRQDSTFYLLCLGLVVPLVFAGTLVVCGLRLGHYNHLSRMVSELGALGTPTQFTFSVGLVSCSLLSLGFVVGLFRACRARNISVVPAALILAFTVSIAGAGLFPLPLRMHMIAGMPSVLLVFSPLAALVLWRDVPDVAGVRPLAALSLLVMSLGFLAFVPDVWSDYAGLKQRFFHAGWAIWFAGLSYRFASQHARERFRTTLVDGV
jgi:hypothetical membrane protein